MRQDRKMPDAGNLRAETSLRRILFLVAVGLVLGGCAGSQAVSENWSRAGATQEAAAQHLRDCAAQADAALASQAAGKAVAKGDEGRSARFDRLVGRCMIMRGYLIDK